MMNATTAIELCALCPIEPACERRQMLDHFSGRGTAPGGCEPMPTVQGQPYRCWLLSAHEAAKLRG